MKISKQGWLMTTAFGLSTALGLSVTGLSSTGYDSKSGATKKAPPATVPMQAPSTDGSSSSIDRMIPKIKVKGAIDASKLSLGALKKHEGVGNPLGNDFSYPEAFAKLDVEQVKKDMRAVLTRSREFWPADYGNYGPLFIRLSWHSAGTYRAIDGRGGSDGGQMRFYPLANWPDNGNLDKARQLIQPVVDKYYPSLSWADAMILAGDIAMQEMGFDTLGVAFGRVDDWEPDMVYWGPEDEFLQSERFNENGELALPLAASVMGLIYVNPEGPDGKPDPLKAAERIRLTFGRMGMNDEETVALIAGGHTFGKAHGAPKPENCQEKTVQGVKEGATQGQCPEAKGPNTNTSGIEGAWTPKPVEWTHEYLTNLFKYEWKLQKGPGGKYQWYAPDLEESDYAPDAHNPSKLVPIMMLTTDLSLKLDPTYEKISRRFLNDPDAFADAFARAWFKLIHRDLGPKSRYLGKDFPKEDFIWQDPLPKANYGKVSKKDIKLLAAKIRKSGLSIQDRIKTAWAAAASYRGTDMRGGINGARIRLLPQKNWTVNEPKMLQKNLAVLEEIQNQFNTEQQKKKVSLADLIVLAGNTAVEDAAKKAGIRLKLSFKAGRTDANQAQTDVSSFDLLKVTSDGFRNYHNSEESYLDTLEAFVNRADFLNLTKREMTVLTGGLRVLGANYQDSASGVFTQSKGHLTNDFFKVLLDNSITWKPDPEANGIYQAVSDSVDQPKWSATSQDLLFGLNGELRLIAFTYASKNDRRKFAYDFARAWEKVMNLDVR